MDKLFNKKVAEILLLMHNAIPDTASKRDAFFAGLFFSATIIATADEISEEMKTEITKDIQEIFPDIVDYCKKLIKEAEK